MVVFVSLIVVVIVVAPAVSSKMEDRPERPDRPWLIARWASFVDDYITETEFRRWWGYLFSRVNSLWVRQGRPGDYSLQIATGPSIAELEAMGYFRGGLWD